jgi:hypothetical protein
MNNLLQTFINYLLSQKKKPSFFTTKNYKADINQFITWFEKQFNNSFDPSEVTFQTIQSYKKSKALSPRSFKRHTSSLKRFFKFLYNENIISSDPFDGVISEKEPKKDIFGVTNFKNYLYDQKKTPLTIKNYINDIKVFISWVEKMSLHKSMISYSLLHEYKKRLIAADFSPRTINRKLSSLRTYMAWAEKLGVIPSSHSGKSRHLGTHPESDSGVTPLSGVPQNDKHFDYSPLPPIRLAQKTLKAMDYVFDSIFVYPVAKLAEKANLKSLRTSTNNQNENLFTPKVTNIQKRLYAPLDLSLNTLPVHRKMLHFLRHSRPKWYKIYHGISMVHYIHFAVLIIATSIMTMTMYNHLFATDPKQTALIQTKESEAKVRTISFKGKILNSAEAPINKQSRVTFSIYNHSTRFEDSLLWQEIQSVHPNLDGSFTVELGSKNKISNNIFTKNPELFLGIKVNEKYLFPRQSLSTALLSEDSLTLQGMKPTTKTDNHKNVILALDSNGDLAISGNTTFQSTDGEFVLSGNSLSLVTNPGSNNDININPDGNGRVNLPKAIHNASNNINSLEIPGAVTFDDIVAVNATSSAYSALNINQNGTGPIISASSSGTAKFVLESDGTAKFEGGLNINGGYLSSTNTTFDLLNSDVNTLNIGGEADLITIGETTGKINMQGSVSFGDKDTDTITFNGRVAKDSNLVPISTDGTNNIGSSSVPWDNIYSSNIQTDNIFAKTLDIKESKEATASAQIFNTHTGTDADGLIVKLGNSSAAAVSSNNHFLNFQTSGIGVVGSIQGNGAKGVQYKTSGIADFAEYVKKDKNTIIEFGSLVCLDSQGKAVKCDIGQRSMVGVASENPAFLGGANLGNGSIAVGLVGQVATFVSDKNGDIRSGDNLTLSDIPGVAVKANDPGQIIGKALEDSSDSKIAGYYNPEDGAYKSKSELSNIPIKPDIIPVKKIYVLVSLSWHDPGAYLADSGELVINVSKDPEQTNTYSISSPLEKSLTNLGAFFEIVSARIRTGFLQAKEITTDSLIVTSDSLIINGESLKEYISASLELRAQSSEQDGVISPVINANTLAVNTISPLSEESVTVNGKLVIKNNNVILSDNEGSKDSSPRRNVGTQNDKTPDIALEVQGNASFSGTLASNELSANELRTNNATISGTLNAQSITAGSIQGLDDIINNKISLIDTKYIDISSHSAKLLLADAFEANTAEFHQGLMAFGPTSLSDTSITGQLRIGGTMFLTQNSLETLGSDLSIQSLRQGGLSIMAGLLYIDTDGNIKAKGDVEIQGNLAVNVISPIPGSDLSFNNASGSAILSINQTGDLTSSGSATFSKLNLNLVKPALALSPIEVIASSSAGVTSIKKNQKEMTIINSIVTDQSLIYISPVGTPSAQLPFLLRQNEESFTVGVEKKTIEELFFNWLIVN